jgi:hypothetical protein
MRSPRLRRALVRRICNLHTVFVIGFSRQVTMFAVRVWAARGPDLAGHVMLPKGIP